MKTVNLINNGVGRYEDSTAFIHADNDLEIKIKGLPPIKNTFTFVAELNNYSKKTILGKDCTVIIPSNEITSGTLTCVIQQYANGNLVKEYAIEPLIIKTAEVGGWKSVAEITALEAKANAIEGKIKAIENKLETELNGLKTQLASHEKIIVELVADLEQKSVKRDISILKYIFKQYQGDMKTNEHDLPISEFLSAIGFDADEVTITEIIKEVKL